MSPADTSPEFTSIRYIEPALYFSSIRMEIGEAAAAEVMTVSELVTKDQVLLEFTSPEQFSEMLIEKQPVTVGANCYLSADSHQVLAAVTGYPKLQFSQLANKETSTLHISVEPLFRISADQMKAAIAIHPPIAGCQSLKDFGLYQLLSDEGIVFGIDKAMVENARECIKAGLPEFNIMILATGKKARNGTDAHLEFEIETGPIPGKILNDGTIDFRERLIFVPVSKGQVIARKIPPTRGTPGKTIRGERVEPQPGKDISVNTLKDASYSSRTRTVTATSDGVLSVVGDTIIKVCSRQEIMGDIDYATGHIQSRNCVLIHGSVQPGFRVRTDGDLEIRGTVMSTRVSSQSNIVVKSGILGKNSSVFALGDADIYFVEQGEVECGRNCIIRKESYYSNIIAGKNILCMPNSAVVGGRLIAEGNITLGSVGSANASPALLAAGVDGRRLLLYKDLQKSLVEQQEILIRWMQLHKGTSRARKIRKLEQEIEEIRSQLLRINLIPGTARFSRPLEDERSTDGSAIAIQDIGIEIQGIVYAGTVIQIGNRSMTLSNTISNRLFRLSDSLTEIAALPIRRR